MQLDIVIPTFNRCESLARTLRSLLAASVPAGLDFRVFAVDNRSGDRTKEVVERIARESARAIRYVPEFEHQGRSFALNTGICKSNSGLIGFIDDDEEIDADWLQVIFRAFQDLRLDYIGGPYLPRWECEPPNWVNHTHTRTALGWANFGGMEKPYGEPGFDALLMGGNCVLRRSCFQDVGLYSTSLGRKGKRLLAGEDADMHERLMAAGLHGLYLPDLRVYHHIPVERLRKNYMRRWAFWASASNGLKLRIAKSQQGARWFGLPRYMYVNALRSPVRWWRARSGTSPAEVFHHELSLWRFAGTFYGRNFLSTGAGEKGDRRAGIAASQSAHARKYINQSDGREFDG